MVAIYHKTNLLAAMNFEFIFCSTTTFYENIYPFQRREEGNRAVDKLAQRDDDDHSISSETVSSSTLYSDDDSFLDDDSMLDEEEWTKESSSASVEALPCLSQQFAQLSLEELEECLSCMQAQVGMDHPLTAQVWNELGLRYYNSGDLEPAVYCFRNAALACPTCHLQIAHAYFHLGRCYTAQWDTRREAFDLFLLAAESYEFLAAYDAQDRTHELTLIDGEITQLLQQKE